MVKVSKRVRKARESFDCEAVFSLKDAVSMAKEMSSATKFDETIDVAINLNIDTKKVEQNLRGVISLPNGTGKTIKVAAFVKEDKAQEAKDAGADLVGADDLVEIVKSGKIDFDRCVATPDMMGVVGKVAKILGPKGLMPNPKLGTVSADFVKAIKEIKSGQIEYRAEKNGIVHAGLGKSSFAVDHLIENVKYFIDSIVKAKPSTVKGVYLNKVVISSTMGPSLKVDISSI